MEVVSLPGRTSVGSGRRDVTNEESEVVSIGRVAFVSTGSVVSAVNVGTPVKIGMLEIRSVGMVLLIESVVVREGIRVDSVRVSVSDGKIEDSVSMIDVTGTVPNLS